MNASMPKYCSSAKLAGTPTVAAAFSTLGWLLRNAAHSGEMGPPGGLVAAAS